MLPLRSHSFRGARWGTSADRKLILARDGGTRDSVEGNGPLCVEDQLPIVLFPDCFRRSALQTRGIPGL